MVEYIPPGAFQLPQDPNGCVAYSFAFAIAAATNGAAHPSGAQIHNATHDHSGGLELVQCAVVAIRDYGLHVTTGVFTRAAFEARAFSGQWIFVMIGGYRPVGESAFTGQPGGSFNHGIAGIPIEKAMDPLADGRRPGIYRFHGAQYPRDLIREFAANLRMQNGSLAGDDHFEASFIPAPTPAGPLHPHVRVATGSFVTFTVHNTGKLHAVGHSTRKLPKETMIPCGLREYPVYVNATTAVPMRQLMGGPFAGYWVVSHGPLPFSQ